MTVDGPGAGGTPKPCGAGGAPPACCPWFVPKAGGQEGAAGGVKTGDREICVWA